MSANDHTTALESHDEAHTGPIKTPGQLLAASALFFILPIFIIIGLVYYVTSANKTAPGAVDTEKALAMRIQKIGSVEIRFRICSCSASSAASTRRSMQRPLPA